MMSAQVRGDRGQRATSGGARVRSDTEHWQSSFAYGVASVCRRVLFVGPLAANEFQPQ